MAELVPMSLAHLARRALAEHRERREVFDLQERKWYVGDPALDTSVVLHGERAATPVGPAAGPHTQLAQNIVLSYLAGARVMELKTVQILDDLKIPRPCIDARNVGYNVEWSQELKVPQSVDEYVKAWMLLRILREAGITTRMHEARPEVLFDLSVGYSLEGIRSEKVTGFVRAMLDATDVVERLRREELRGDLARFADLDFAPRLGDCITLSTFHGCPAGEIEGICRYLLEELGVHVVVKMNPTLLGYRRVLDTLHGRLGYHDIHPVESEFERDLQFDQAVAMVKRLRAIGEERGLDVGAKFTNTLVVENRLDWFPESEARMYLSGAPLHVLALELAYDFRKAVGADVPTSFSGGVTKESFVGLVASGLAPVTTCTDLLRSGGYGRLTPYLTNLEAHMRKLGVSDLGGLVSAELGAEPLGLPDHASRTLRVMERVVERTGVDPRYSKAKNSAVPRKVGSHLVLLDCLSCDKCIAVCPNDANFLYEVTPDEVATEEAFVAQDGTLGRRPGLPYVAKKAEQYANYADWCNDCGNCDVFCPEDGGPYVVKPRFFGSAETWLRDARHGGFFVEVAPSGGFGVRARIDGHDYTLRCDRERERAWLSDDVLVLEMDSTTGAVLDVAPAVGVAPAGHVLSSHPGHVILAIVGSVLDPRRPNPINPPWLTVSGPG